MTTTSTSRRGMPVWAVILLILIIGVGATFAGFSVGKILGADETRDVQVVRSVRGEEQVILMTAGITDVKEQRDNQKFFGLFDIPLSDRTVFLRYEFDAKFGIEGKDVRIDRTGDKEYRITIPKFQFLGYDNPDFSVATESNGLLSWTTPEIDKLKATEELLGDDAVGKHLDGLRPILEVQANKFYSRIVSSIDPEATLTFAFEK